MWGQVCQRNSRAEVHRIIPTRVGTSSSFVKLRKLVEDHPHACGDKMKDCAEKASALGSSPRVWGQEYVNKKRSAGKGIIPTRVGTSLHQDGQQQYEGDHPHACGDKRGFCFCYSSREGSSPRVWGQEYVRITLTTKNRIIPTRVGTRRFFKDRKSFKEDHPHACGDK